ncbi:glycosyltransferase [Pararhizobium antarcticum]|uniref:Glycosyl transferase n=1 Tax=Pararhizobium antarcticum TaxID=1798805 RepID=A0A657LNK9_9HYPH|nr:glycosyltransferase [Pararhizobium antarcticum]OJF92219.1 glycosyl transferase [Pararhizobium antarcticum]OJF94898.1 glycosyl transferase [Rhizobium sp. 58]
MILTNTPSDGPSSSTVARHAFVTLVTNADYAKGATALARSLRLTGTTADIVILHTGGVSAADLRPLQMFGCRLIETDLLPLSDAFNERHARQSVHARAPFSKGRKPAFHSLLDNFCKLRLWQLVEYERCIFIDADALVLKPIDRYFDYPEFCAAPNVYESLADFHRLNSGVFVAKPSLATYEAMLARLDVPDAFWPRTDQTFLQSFFPEWHGLPVTMNMLQYVWFTMPELWDWPSISILHYQYEKPWENDHPKADRLQPLIDLWYGFFTGETVPALAELSNPAGSNSEKADSGK